MKYTFQDIAGQVVVVTGAGRGIGKETAKLFSENGAKVALCDIDEQVVAGAGNEIREGGGEVLSLVCDITERSSVDSMTKKVFETWGRIDCLVNNAGITKDGLFFRMKPDDWEFIIKANLTGTYHCSQSAVNYMRKQRKGNIINLSSLARTGNPGQVNYSAAKAGVVGFTKALARELASFNIRVNCVAPGYVETRLTEAIPDKLKDEMVKRIPLGRKGQPIDIAGPILFLASELSSYMTGQVLNVSGGVDSM